MSNYARNRDQYRYRRPLPDWVGTVVVTLAIGGLIAALLFGLSSCEDAATTNFTDRCLAAHPGSHVTVESHVVYKSYSITRYCLGAEGQLWSVE